MQRRASRGRSRLYRSQILQVNMRLKALAEIYIMHYFARLCNLIFSQKLKQKWLQNAKFCKFGKFSKNSENFSKFWQNSSIFFLSVILELCKRVHCVDLGESFQTHIFLQNLASIQPNTSPVKFAASRSDHRRIVI